MGHYDEAYEADRQEAENDRRIDLKRKISKRLDKITDIDHLCIISDVVDNIRTVEKFFKLMTVLGKGE